MYVLGNKRNFMLYHLTLTYILHSTFFIFYLQALFFQTQQGFNVIIICINYAGVYLASCWVMTCRM